MKKKHLLKLVMYSVAFLMLIIRCNSQSLKGEWICSTENGQISLSFLDNNQLTFDGQNYSYKTEQSSLIVTVEGQSINYPFWFQDDHLYIYFPEGYTLQFKQSSRTLSQKSDNTKQQTSKASAGNKYLSGRLCYYGGSSSYSTYSSYSRTNSYYFDGNGNFKYYQEQAYNDANGSAYNSDNSGTQHGTYRISGNRVYVKFSTGQAYTYNIHYTQNDGRITELKSNDEYYASGLCE